jgi:hypothetical protein
MSPSAQLTSEQLTEIIEDEKMTDQGAREVQEHVDGEDLDPDHTSKVLNTVPNTIINESEHKCLQAAVRLLNSYPIHQSIDDRVPGHKY